MPKENNSNGLFLYLVLMMIYNSLLVALLLAPVATGSTLSGNKRIGVEGAGSDLSNHSSVGSSLETLGSVDLQGVAVVCKEVSLFVRVGNPDTGIIDE